MSSRRTRMRRRRGGPGGVIIRVIAVALVATVFLGVAGTATAYGFVRSWLAKLPSIESPNAFDLAQATQIYSADGELLARLYLENRTVVPISKISTDLVNAIVAVEDERFYEHRGVDVYGIVRAAVKDVATGSLEEGASTITQQYIRNTLLADEATDISFARKVREAYLASELEKRKTKQQILGLYLNTVYFGEGAYGAEAAAQAYFAKHARNLTLSEAALIAGLPQSPIRLSPYDNIEGATRRRTVVLQRMLANGYITEAQYESANAAPVDLKQAAEPAFGIYRAHYFVAQVKKLLQQRYGTAEVFKGGLRVHTTLDTRLQAYAESAVHDALDRPDDPDGALVSIDPRNGYVKALVGGEDYSRNKFNLATQGKRQPGSSFKTFVLVTALEEGMPPTRFIDSSSPAFIPLKPKPWTPSNSEGQGHGYMSIISATRASVNTVFARLIMDVGPSKVARVARRMGILSELPAYPSIALGSQNVTPLEMASAYGTLATNGVRYPPIFISKITDAQGRVLYRAKPRGARALSPEVAYAATRILEGVISGGTGTRARIGRPQAGKTGTSQDYRDAWFVGYTPQLSTSVWVGYYKSERSMRNVHGKRGFGGTLAAPIWHDFMIEALKGEPVLSFKRQPAPDYTWKSSWGKRYPAGTKPDDGKGGTTDGTGTKPDAGTGGGTSGGGTSGGGTGGGGNTGGGGKPKPPKPPPSTDPSASP